MTIDEAIQDLKFCLQTRAVNDYHDYNPAIQLGIEALKHLRRERLDYGERYGELLLGETKEE